MISFLHIATAALRSSKRPLLSRFETIAQRIHLYHSSMALLFSPYQCAGEAITSLDDQCKRDSLTSDSSNFGPGYDTSSVIEHKDICDSGYESPMSIECLPGRAIPKSQL